MELQQVAKGLYLRASEFVDKMRGEFDSYLGIEREVTELEAFKAALKTASCVHGDARRQAIVTALDVHVALPAIRRYATK
jgi:hypothetical protein